MVREQFINLSIRDVLNSSVLWLLVLLLSVESRKQLGGFAGISYVFFLKRLIALSESATEERDDWTSEPNLTCFIISQETAAKGTSS